jgi:hypothetical protein
MGKVQLVKKTSHAICEAYGSALCQDHIVKTTDGKYFCEIHDPHEPSLSDERGNEKLSSSIKKGIGSLLKRK